MNTAYGMMSPSILVAILGLLTAKDWCTSSISQDQIQSDPYIGFDMIKSHQFLISYSCTDWSHSPYQMNDSLFIVYSNTDLWSLDEYIDVLVQLLRSLRV